MSKRWQTRCRFINPTPSIVDVKTEGHPPAVARLRLLGDRMITRPLNVAEEPLQSQAPEESPATDCLHGLVDGRKYRLASERPPDQDLIRGFWSGSLPSRNIDCASQSDLGGS